MGAHEELTFSIPAYTPETMPAARLVEYVQQVIAVFGEAVANELHLVRIEQSSTRPVFLASSDTARLAREQAAVVGAGGGTKRQRAAYDRIREMVRKDGGQAARLMDRGGVLLDFEPGSEIVATVRQSTTFDGVLARVGGVGEHSTILMQDFDGQVQPGFTAARALGKEMGKHLYEPVRVSGTGQWDRWRSGSWTLSRMLIQSFEPLPDERLAETMHRLAAVDAAWPDDYADALASERAGS